MARASVTPCPVPRCKGTLEPGTRAGKPAEWCRACERRIAQLEALHEARTRDASEPAAKAMTEAQLMKLVQERCWNLGQCSKATRRSINLIRHAMRSGQIPSARIGRYHILPKASSAAWSKAYVRRTGPSKLHLATVAALPREASEALTLGGLARRAKRSRTGVAAWERANRKDPRLQRVPVFDEKQRPVVGYWWKEAANA